MKTWRQWARVNATDLNSPSELKRGSLAALTGQDTRALNAIVACWELYAGSDGDGRRAALEAVRALLPAMQESTRWIAKELIPFALEWNDRARLWPLVTWENVPGPPRIAECLNVPGPHESHDIDRESPLWSVCQECGCSGRDPRIADKCPGSGAWGSWGKVAADGPPVPHE